MKGYRLLLLAAFALAACQQTGKQTAQQESEHTAKADIPAFATDSAYTLVEKQLAFGPRVPGTPAQEKCAAWLINSLRPLADTVYVQRATVTAPKKKQLPCINIIATFNPAAKRRILLLAHWDTRALADKDAFNKTAPMDGADDGASGVAVLLETARQLHAKKPAYGIDILLTDVEDYGESEVEHSYCLGTQYWAKNPHVPGYKADYGILLDMVGGKNAAFYMESFSKQYAQAQTKLFWDVANKAGYSDYFRYEDNGTGAEDDHYYVNTLANIPTLDIIATQPNGNFMPHHHTSLDNLAIIDRRTMQAVGQSLLHLLYTDPFNY